MYTVDGDDRVIKLQDVPQSDVGAPAPIVLADEQTTLLGYVIQGTPYPFDGRVLTDADLQIFAQQLALIEFSLSHSYMFGAPNDEALCGHPLASRGLEAYGAFDVFLINDLPLFVTRSSSSTARRRPSAPSTTKSSGTSAQCVA